MRDFRDILQNVVNTNNSLLLLGNGFTISAGDRFEFFRYQNVWDELFDTSEIKNLSLPLQDLISDKRNACGPEEILEYLYRLKQNILFDTCRRYLKPQPALDTLNHDITNLKNMIINLFYQNHPKQGEFTEQNPDFISNCGNNIARFRSIYTLNYDLLLCWIINEYNREYSRENNKDFFNDSFWNPCDESILEHQPLFYDRCNIFYMHGALHLIVRFLKPNSAYKKVAKETLPINKPLLEQTIDFLKADQDHYNLICFEGESAIKAAYIEKHGYLKQAFENLSNEVDKLTCSYLVIYGCSIVKSNGHGGYKINNDENLWRRIMNLNFGTIFISSFDRSPEEMKAIRMILNSFRQKSDLNIQFFRVDENIHLGM